MESAVKMKFKTTQKAIKSNFSKVFAIGYADAQYLLNFENPMAYTCGVYGWNCDIYNFGNIAITTGYRSFGKSLPYELVKEYNDKAREILKSDAANARSAILSLLWDDFLNAIDK